MKNYFNSDALQKVIFVNKELQFKKEQTKYSSMCSALHSYHRKMLVIIRMLESLIQEKNLWNYFDLIGAIAILVFPISLVTFVISLLFGIPYTYLIKK